MIELHAAHGYLLSASSRRSATSAPTNMAAASRTACASRSRCSRRCARPGPSSKPMSVRISANDWMDDGVTPARTVAIGRAFAEAGADLIDVSAGQTWADAQPVYGRMFQTPFADQIRNEAGSRPWRSATSTSPTTSTRSSPPAAPTSAALARPHLIDPMWTLRAAAEQDYRRSRLCRRNILAAAPSSPATCSAKPSWRGGMRLWPAATPWSPAAAPASAPPSPRAGGEGARLTLIGRRRTRCRRRPRRSRTAQASPADVTDEPAVDAALRAGARSARADRDPGQQCRRRRIARRSRHRRWRCCARCWRSIWRRVPLLPGRAAGPARGRIRPDRHRRLDRRPEGLRLHRRLYRRQARRGRPDPRARAGDREHKASR